MSDELKLKLSLNNQKKLNETYLYLFNKYKGLVAFIASRYLADACDIDDVVYEVFLMLFKNPNTVKKSVKGYLVTNAKYLAIKILKERNHYINDLDSNYGDEKSSIKYTFIVNEIKKVLNEEDFIIIYNHFFEDLTFKEIALKLNKKEASIKSIYYRSLKKAKNKLKELN